MPNRYRWCRSTARFNSHATVLAMHRRVALEAPRGSSRTRWLNRRRCRHVRVPACRRILLSTRVETPAGATPRDRCGCRRSRRSRRRGSPQASRRRRVWRAAARTPRHRATKPVDGMLELAAPLHHKAVLDDAALDARAGNNRPPARCGHVTIVPRSRV